MNTFKLANGTHIPSIGLGTWKSSNEDAYKAVKWALDAGYRHIDTAKIYGNEEGVGRAICDADIPREEIFITTKLWNTDQGYESTKKAIQDSLDSLGLDYIDLYLIHWFKGFEKALDTWRAIEEFYRKGKLKAIGVSNYNVHHIMYLLEHAEIKPMVNQIETHVELQNEFLQKYCQQNNIQVEAYAPFMSWRVGELLEKEVLRKIAKNHNKSVTQVTLRWLHQRGIVALPKSVNQQRITDNFNVFDFELDENEMDQIKALNRGNKMFTEFDNVPY